MCLPSFDSQSSIPLMRKGAQSLPTASIQATHPSPSLLDYASTKAAILAFTRALARQVAQDGIRVNCVAPGPVWTPLQISGGQPQKKIPECGAETPMKRAGQPVEMSPLYVLLASQESSYVTGEVYGATGGLGSRLSFCRSSCAWPCRNHNRRGLSHLEMRNAASEGSRRT